MNQHLYYFFILNYQQYIKINPDYFSRGSVTLAYCSWFTVEILFLDKLISIMMKKASR